MKEKQGLPIGTQHFAGIREDNVLYIDKTKMIVELVKNPGEKHFFLSRPRRFGKSLFISTLKSAFKGEKQHFKGLYLEKNWDWSKKHPVIHISFGGGVISQKSQVKSVWQQICEDISYEHDISIRGLDERAHVSNLIRDLYRKYNQKVVILVDEYDKPILDNILNPKIAAELRDELKNIYSIFKDEDQYIEFTFITGVTKFSKVSLFSGLNNLQDITLEKKYGEICGFTEQEITDNFEGYLSGIDRKKMKQWYNGYSFLGDNTVYNPFGTLLFLKHKEYKNYWFETGSPSFLIELIKEKNYNIANIENIIVSEELIGSFDIENISLETLLFQSGYLTIGSYIETLSGKREFLLQYPNTEVKMSLSDSIINTIEKYPVNKAKNVSSLILLLKNGDINGMKEVFHSFFASIPHDWYRKNDIGNYEGYYASIFYCYFASLGLNVCAENTTNKGRIDMSVEFPAEYAKNGKNAVYIFEFKVKEYTKDKNTALQQIQEKKYHEKFIERKNTDIFLIGAEFSKEEKNITHFEWKKA